MRHLSEHSVFVPCAGCPGVVRRDRDCCVVTGAQAVTFWHGECLETARALRDTRLPPFHVVHPDIFAPQAPRRPRRALIAQSAERRQSRPTRRPPLSRHARRR